jgi:23S rRNA A2030 N6-methylase RlmJ
VWTKEKLLEMFAGYVNAFVCGAYGGGWRLPGRPNKCGKMNADSEQAFATRAHNHAAAMLKETVNRADQMVVDLETGALLDALTTPVEPPKPPRAIVLIDADAQRAADNYMSGNLDLQEMNARLLELHAERKDSVARFSTRADVTEGDLGDEDSEEF